MRQICEIRKLTGGRYLVRLEDGEAFPLYGKELDSFALEEGGMLPEETCGQIMREILPKRARLCALHTLEKLDRTEQQLREKLTRLYYPEEIVEDAVAYVKGFHYIDDLRYARHYLEQQGRQKSLRRMEQELLARGISREVFLEAAESAERPDEEAQIAALLQKKNYDSQNASPADRSRLYAFLMRRGYGAEAVRRALNL